MNRESAELVSYHSVGTPTHGKIFPPNFLQVMSPTHPRHNYYTSNSEQGRGVRIDDAGTKVPIFLY